MNKNKAFGQIRENRTEFQLKWILRTFAGGNTYRFLPKRFGAHKVRERIEAFVQDGKLDHVRNQRSFNSFRKQLTERLMRKSGLGFGRSVKLVDLFIKEASSRRGVLQDQRAEQIAAWANVPVDRVILDRLWKDYPQILQAAKITRSTAIKDLKRRQYHTLQTGLKNEARKEQMKAIDYDLYWSNRGDDQQEPARGNIKKEQTKRS